MISSREDKEFERKKLEIETAMHGIYEFLQTFSIANDPSPSEYKNLITELENFEKEMLNEAKTNKKRNWRDPIKTIKKLDETIHQVFHPQNDLDQRIQAISDFQAQARNAKFTIREKILLTRVVGLIGAVGFMITFLPLAAVAPAAAIVGIAAASLVLATLFGMMAHTIYSAFTQDDKRGLAVSNSLTAMCKKPLMSSPTFFGPAKATPKDNLAAAATPALTPAFAR